MGAFRRWRDTGSETSAQRHRLGTRAGAALGALER
jgi:hypothetical protein